MTDPIVYATLMEDRLRELHDELDEQAAIATSHLERTFQGWFMTPLREAIKRSYVRGVCDGFAQGVAVEADKSASTIRRLEEANAEKERAR